MLGLNQNQNYSIASFQTEEGPNRPRCRYYISPEKLEQYRQKGITPPSYDMTQQDSYLIMEGAPKLSGRNIRKLFSLVDIAFRKTAKDPQGPNFSNSGSTAALAHISTDGYLRVANIGDSEVNIYVRDKNGYTEHVETVTKSHKPDYSEEIKRIEREGGFVAPHPDDPLERPRLNGTILISRSFGNFDQKGMGIKPYVQKVNLNRYFAEGSTVFITTDTDGAFENTTHAHRIEAIEYSNSSNIAEYLVHAANHRGATDNITCQVLTLKEKPSNDVVLGVFDGCGPEGGKASNFARDTFKNALETLNPSLVQRLSKWLGPKEKSEKYYGGAVQTDAPIRVKSASIQTLSNLIEINFPGVFLPRSFRELWNSLKRIPSTIKRLPSAIKRLPNYFRESSLANRVGLGLIGLVIATTLAVFGLEQKFSKVGNEVDQTLSNNNIDIARVTTSPVVTASPATTAQAAASPITKTTPAATPSTTVTVPTPVPAQSPAVATTSPPRVKPAPAANTDQTQKFRGSFAYGKTQLPENAEKGFQDFLSKNATKPVYQVIVKYGPKTPKKMAYLRSQEIASRIVAANRSETKVYTTLVYSKANNTRLYTVAPATSDLESNPRFKLYSPADNLGASDLSGDLCGEATCNENASDESFDTSVSKNQPRGNVMNFSDPARYNPDASSIFSELSERFRAGSSIIKSDPLYPDPAQPESSELARLSNRFNHGLSVTSPSESSEKSLIGNVGRSNGEALPVFPGLNLAA